MKMKNYLWMGFVLIAGGGLVRGDENPSSWDITCEVFSLPMSEAAKLKRLRKSDAEDYAELVKRLESGKVVQEEFLMFRTLAESATTVEEISEMIYATEYEPPELPNNIGDLGDDPEKAKQLVTPATPSAFDTKNVGSTMEVEISKWEDEDAEVRISLTLVNFLGRQVWGQELAEAEMPKFAVQKIQTGAKVKADVPELIGSISPPEALQPEEGERRVWLAFVTASKAKE